MDIIAQCSLSEWTHKGHEVNGLCHSKGFEAQLVEDLYSQLDGVSLNGLAHPLNHMSTSQSANRHSFINSNLQTPSRSSLTSTTMASRAQNRQRVDLWLDNVPSTLEDWVETYNTAMPNVPGTPEPKTIDEKTFSCSGEIAGIQVSVSPPSEAGQDLNETDKKENTQAEEQPNAGADYSRYRDNVNDDQSEASVSCITFECSEHERLYELWCICEDSDAAEEEREAAAYDLAEAAWGFESDFWKCNTKNDASGRKVV
jgi:hypothetical protein